MKRICIITCLCLFCLNSMVFARTPVHYYFKTMDTRDGLSQNTVNQILQDRVGFMWFGTKGGLNRYDGINVRIYQKENSGLNRNFITALYEDKQGNIWTGTDGGVFIYDPQLDVITPFTHTTAEGIDIHDWVTRISSDGKGHIYLSVDNQGLFCYDEAQDSLNQVVSIDNKSNITCFWFTPSICWLAMGADNLFCTSSDFDEGLHPFVNAKGEEVFKGDIINDQVNGSHNRMFVASRNGLTEINLTTNRTRRLLNVYARTLQFKDDTELWVGTETGLYIYNLTTEAVTHISVPAQDDYYALADNAIYSLCRDSENGMWIGTYFGGANYYPYQWTYFEKYYPHDFQSNLGRRVREICEGNDGTLWIGTEDKGLFNFNPQTGNITPFTHPQLYHNIHGLCLDGDNLWVGTFSGGLNRINLRTRQLKHYSQSDCTNAVFASDIFAVKRTTLNELWVGTTSGLYKYNQAADNFTRIPIMQLNLFIYDILEDFNGNLWFATYANGLYFYNVRTQQWKNYLPIEGDERSFPYNRVISIFEDSKKRLWFATLGGGFCQYNPDTDDFTRYQNIDGINANTIYKIVEDKSGNLWITTNNGLVCFNPETNQTHTYSTSNGLLSDQFNFQSGYCDKQGRIYLGSIKGLIAFSPEGFAENSMSPNVVLTDFYLFNKRQQAGVKGSPLRENISLAKQLDLKADENSISFKAAVLSYQAPEMNHIEYQLKGFDREWYMVPSNSLIQYSSLPYGSYTLCIRGANSDNVWSTTECTLDITIHPPFYLTTWAYIIYILLGVGGFVGIIYQVRRRAAKKHRYKMESFEREKERELYQTKIDFFTNVAHEIRTPLTLIKSPLENVLASDKTAGEIREDLETMELNANRLLNLVNQLLDFRKTETQGFQLNFVCCNVTEIIQETWKRFKPMARERGLTMTSHVADQLQASVDHEALVKIISNLFTNAVKYANTYISLTLEREEDNFVLTMSNDGAVIPMEMREEIFKPFVQYRADTTASVSGTGIGLALSRSLAELHEGTLQMDDMTTENCFVLTLPIHHKHTYTMTQDVSGKDDDTTQQTATQTDADANAVIDRPTILVVEDHTEMQIFIVKQFAPQYRVLTAANGQEALEALQQHTVHLVISDIMMPIMDGMELCKEIKSDVNTSHIPIILLTAKTTMQSKIEGMSLGADAYIEKPFSVEYLRVCVTNLLTNREKLRASFVHQPFVQMGTLALSRADEKFLQTLRDLVMENMQNPDFCLEDMASKLNMSRSSLNRKLKGLLDMTPNDYIRLERLKRSAQLLKEGSYKVNEVCYMTGFNTPSYFTKCFQKQFGVLPKEFMK